MLILALDTATAVSSVAVATETTVLAEVTQEAKLTHSETLVPHIGQVLKMAGAERADLDGIAVSIGPGSFTGLRIGLATAKAMAYALRIPIAGIPTLEGLALHFPQPGISVAACLDAQKGNAYVAVYGWEDGSLREKEAVQILPMHEIIARCGAWEGPIVLNGDIIKKRRAKLGELPPNVRIAPPQLLMPRAANIAMLGLPMLASGNAGNAMGMEPLYIRRSEAEVLWEKRHPQGNESKETQ